MEKNLLFTHTDLDGIGCAVTAFVYGRDFKEEFEVVFCENDDVNDTIEPLLRERADTFDNIYITDLSVNEKLAELIDSTPSWRSKVRLFDHHASANWLNKYSWAEVFIDDVAEAFKPCGTSLFYRYLYPGLPHNNRLSEFVSDVRLWDTWAWKDTEAVRPQIYAAALKRVGRTAFISEMVETLSWKQFISKEWEDRFFEEQQLKQQYIEDVKSRAFNYTDSNGVTYACAFASNHLSETGNALALEHPECVCSLVIHEHGISLRGVKNDFDCSALASKLGGGGHPKAAGFNLSENKKKRIMEVILSEEE